ncbi:MAG: DUF3369 domain-containing protein [Proteobacteria bacterium]|nr:DUF3369 domain-containing protein [Pseudomonadota bacterium]
MSNQYDNIITNKDDEFVFADEVKDESAVHAREPWKLMIVDDDEEVHNITHLVLDEFSFQERDLEFLSAYSGEEAKELMGRHPDIAVVLLDVVMETDQSGLEVARYIRDELENTLVRIILRTGHPGQAPERQVIIEYDINDYKEKADLTSQKLFSSVITALRSYRDMKTIEKNRKGLERIVDASASLFKLQALKQFAAGVLAQLTSILDLDESEPNPQPSGFVATRDRDYYNIVAAIGSFEKFIDKPAWKCFSDDVVGDLTRVLDEKRSFFADDRFVGYIQADNRSENLIYLKSHRPFSELDKNLFRILSTNVAIAFDNICLNREIVDTQKEVILTLGEVVETRSKETANHVRRVAELSRLLALKKDLNEDEAELLRQASPMHDVGKIGISDTILNKPSRLTETEYENIKAHSLIGYEILSKSDRKIMKAAAIVALEHHERWDGKGYPKGLKGEEIHIFGRITGLVDVFDALGHRRVYKDAWELDRILDLIKEERGTQFDPTLVDLFLDNLDEILAVKKIYSS